MTEEVILRQGDCLDLMNEVPEASVDMILADLPYGMTRNTWDSIIPFDAMWAGFLRVVKLEGVMVLNAGQPFASDLLCSNRGMYRHEWVWVKNRGSNFANTVREPMKEHKHVLVFGKVRSGWTYNPIPQERSESGRDRVKYGFNAVPRSTNYNRMMKAPNPLQELRGPSSVQHWKVETGLHPTQKPVAMCEYLIRTYTDPGDTVLDVCMGSGTTGVAAVNTGRRFIGFEIEEAYFRTAEGRITKALREARGREAQTDLSGFGDAEGVSP